MGGEAAALVTIIRSWCDRHDASHEPGERAKRAAERMLLVHSFRDDALEYMSRTGRLEPAPHRRDGRVFFFAGPCRREISALAGAFVLKARAEEALLRLSSKGSAEPYDSGGLERYAGMSNEEETACRSAFIMGVPEYRTYLEALLHCSFEEPEHFLSDEHAPRHRLPPTHGTVPAARGICKAFCAKTREGKPNPSCWTPEVSFQPMEEQFDLAHLAKADLIMVALLPDSSFLRLRLNLEKILGAENVRVIAKPTPLAGREAAIRTRRRAPMHNVLADLSGDIQRVAWESP